MKGRYSLLVAIIVTFIAQSFWYVFNHGPELMFDPCACVEYKPPEAGYYKVIDTNGSACELVLGSIVKSRIELYTSVYVDGCSASVGRSQLEAIPTSVSKVRIRLHGLILIALLIAVGIQFLYMMVDSESKVGQWFDKVFSL